jgi:hypothetical protein
MNFLGTQILALTTKHTFAAVQNQVGKEGARFRAVTPLAIQGTTLEKNHGADTWTIIRRAFF